MESFGKFVLVFVGLVFYEVFSGWYPSASFAAVAASAFLAGGAVVGSVIWILGPISKTAEETRRATEHERHRRTDQARLGEVRAFFRRTPHYARTLRTIRDRSVYRDEFGDWVVTPWLDRLTAFIQEKMTDVLPAPLDQESARGFLDVVHRVLEETWAADMGREEDVIHAPRVAHPIDAFGDTCAAMFRRSGFEVRMTDASRDDDAEFLAMVMDARLVVHCTRHSSAIDGEAVQEAAAARRFYDAQSAMIISAQGFTASARQLARKTAVMLVDDRDLPAFLGRVRPRVEATWRQRTADGELRLA
jgi:restriction system protein